jgi:CheY-like chemotaxis protein
MSSKTASVLASSERLPVVPAGLNPPRPTPVGGQSVFLLTAVRDGMGPGDAEAEMRPGPNARSPRILIVDDSRHFLDAARRVLEQDGIAVVGVASTSTEARRLARELRPDGILVDVDLGDESGLDLARELAGSDAVPVILISADPESEFVDLIAASPAVGFVSKSDLSGGTITRLIDRERGPIAYPENLS